MVRCWRWLLLGLAACEPRVATAPPMMPQYATPWMGPQTPATATPRPVAAPAPLAAPSKPRVPRLTLRLLIPAAAKHVPDERLIVELRETGGRSVWRCE